MNKMKNIRIEKVTINMGVGQAGDELKKAEEIVKRISNAKPVQTICKVKQPGWGIRPGLPIGIKLTLRGKKATDFLKQAFSAKDNAVAEKSFDRQGNFGFGIKEHIELPGVKYDPKLGIRGLDVIVTLERAGYRVKKRKHLKALVGKNHCVKRDEAIDFVKKEFGVKVE